MGRVSVRSACEHTFVPTMSSNTKGAVAEQAIVLAAMKLDVRVLRPVAEHGRTDLALDVGGKLWRVQVKWGHLSKARDVIVVSLRTSCCTTRGHVRGTYSEREIDLFGVYCGELDRSYLLPATRFAGTAYAHLRLTPARNGQQSCINLADDFTFDGAVAQLARAMRWQRIGQGFESPQLHSTAESPPPPPNGVIAVRADEFRNRMGDWIDRVAAGQELLITRRGRPALRVSAP